MAKFGYGRTFDDLKYFEARLVFHIPLILYKLEGIVTKFNTKHQFYLILSYLKPVLNKYVFNIPTCTLLAPSSKICRIFLKTFCQH